MVVVCVLKKEREREGEQIQSEDFKWKTTQPCFHELVWGWGA